MTNDQIFDILIAIRRDLIVIKDELKTRSDWNTPMLRPVSDDVVRLAKVVSNYT